MALHSTAQGLAGLGRNGDSVLVHMQPQEVAGLQALAQSQGTSLTINPDTGMPEAFRLGDFFSSLLPTLVGAALAPATGGASLGLTGMAASAAPIVGGMATGALVAGAKGEDILGGALMGGLGGYGGSSLGNSLSNMAAKGGYQAGQAVGPQLTAEGGLSSAGSGQGMMTTLATQAPPSTFMGGLKQMGSGVGELLKPGGYDKFVSPEIGGSLTQIAAPVGMATLSAIAPEPFDYAAEEEKRKAEENKYRGPTGGLNLSPSSGLNLGLPTLAAKGGLMQSYNTGGPVDLNPSVGGGLSDLYNRPEGATTQNLSDDGYGMGRLDKLAQQGSLTKAADMFYAAGGPVSFADGGDTGMNIEGLPSLNVNLVGGPSDSNDTNNSSLLNNPWFGLPKFKGTVGGVEAPTGINSLFYRILGQNARLEPKSYALNVNSGQQEAQYAMGGYLNGDGDGMSDSIPATIEGKQPARLADGEFVIPADVVSHLGNGSSKAGSKRLYAMLDKVRHARTGNKKQGKEIKAEKYLPA